MTTERPLMPNGRLFQSPLGLFGFQVNAVADNYLYGDRLDVIDRGLGKTVIAMALACQLFEDDEIDLVIHVGQGNKIAKDEFLRDWESFTSLRACLYLGTGRTKKLAGMLETGGVDVLLTTYETGKLDLMTRVKTGKRRGKGSRADGPLVAQLGLRHKRILWVFDEVVKLQNRGSELYQAYDYLLGPAGHGGGQLRTGPHRQRVIGMSANPMASDMYVQAFNVARLVMPDRMPTIGQFEERYTHGKGDNDYYLYRKEARTEFAPLFESCIHRVRNTDPEVRAQMPELLEGELTVRLDPTHRQLYEAVQGIFGVPYEELDESQRGQLSSVLRLLLGHPRALLRAQGQLPQAVVAALGAEFLASVPSSKTLRLIEELDSLRGHQVIVFTFYAETVLPELASDLRAAGYRVGTYTGADAASTGAKQAFKDGQCDVLLASDAGAKGLNLPEASYVIEYESARTFDQRMQRFGRHQRITSEASHVYGLTMVAAGTVEVGTVQTVLRRNQIQDELLGDQDAEGYMTAVRRRQMLADSRS